MSPLKTLFKKFLAGPAKEEKAQSIAQSISSRSRIKNPNTVAYGRSGDQAAELISSKLQQFGVRLDSGTSVLDFGAGSGRIALPLTRRHPKVKLTATDVDAEAIEYLSLHAPRRCAARVSSYQPPLQSDDGVFDAIYAISVWSHFPEDLGLNWLEEMHRIIRPAGIVLISVGGRSTLEKSKAKPWTDISLESFERDKFVYKEYVNLSTNQKHYPGISGQGSWGVAAIHPDYIRSQWTELFEVLEIIEAGMPGTQDLVVMRRK